MVRVEYLPVSVGQALEVDVLLHAGLIARCNCQQGWVVGLSEHLFCCLIGSLELTRDQGGSDEVGRESDGSIPLPFSLEAAQFGLAFRREFTRLQETLEFSCLDGLRDAPPLGNDVPVLAVAASDHLEASLKDRSACFARRSKTETYGSSE